MASYNRVILIGNLVRDPELRTTANGASICKLRIATSRSYKAQDGSMTKETTFVDVDCFGRQAETISRYFSKGKPILVEGRLRLNEWENAAGEKQSRLVVVLENFEFVGTRNEGEEAQEAPAEAPVPPARPAVLKKPAPQPVSAPTADIDEDVPF